MMMRETVAHSAVVVVSTQPTSTNLGGNLNSVGKLAVGVQVGKVGQGMGQGCRAVALCDPGVGKDALCRDALSRVHFERVTDQFLQECSMHTHVGRYYGLGSRLWLRAVGAWIGYPGIDVNLAKRVRVHAVLARLCQVPSGTIATIAEWVSS